MDTETKHCLDQFLNDYQFHFATYTLESYKCCIKGFFTFVSISYRDVEASDIRRWMMHLRALKQTSGTIRTKLNSLRTFYNYILDEGMLDKNPAKLIPLPKKEIPDPGYLTEEELQNLRNLVVDKPRERAIIETFYATGVRRSELTNIKQEAISWEERTIHILGKGKKERIVYFTKLCSEAIKDYLHIRNDNCPYLFLNSRGTSISVWVLNELFQKYSKQLGFRVTPHMLRHTFAVRCFQKGMPLEGVQELLGHEEYEDTQVYVQLYNKARKEKYDYYL